jgi:hypothetical protein
MSFQAEDMHVTAAILTSTPEDSWGAPSTSFQNKFDIILTYRFSHYWREDVFTLVCTLKIFV